ncbi:hypothetical protein DHBDCA_p2487 [Dehalobacter sp. DCA]|jgi:Domain of unknown function (DUF1848).|nr:hypothetical protein DHBDCA_p2487 [Dehalobacter sp. DCA]AFV06499.1 hypothetical protein DCF50_p2496 [Dehalobacter sp. CF]
MVKDGANIRTFNIIKPTSYQKIELIQRIAETAKQFGMDMDTCAEDIDCGEFGIRQAHCIDQERFERLGGYYLNVEKDKNQRPECGCVGMEFSIFFFIVFRVSDFVSVGHINHSFTHRYFRWIAYGHSYFDFDFPLSAEFDFWLFPCGLSYYQADCLWS